MNNRVPIAICIACRNPGEPGAPRAGLRGGCEGVRSGGVDKEEAAGESISRRVASSVVACSSSHIGQGCTVCEYSECERVRRRGDVAHHHAAWHHLHRRGGRQDGARGRTALAAHRNTQRYLLVLICFAAHLLTEGFCLFSNGYEYSEF